MESIQPSQDINTSAIYNALTLKFYNLWVLRLSNKWIWRCPTQLQLLHFQQHIGVNHLDIGVGTGYYIKHCRFMENAALSFMDINPSCLQYAYDVNQKRKPKLYCHDVFDSYQVFGERFDSISINYLLHCLPGSMAFKATALNNICAWLKPEGKLFGSTILSDDHLHTPSSRALMRFYQNKHIFVNQQDTLSALSAELHHQLHEVDIEVIGCVALFSGKVQG